MEKQMEEIELSPEDILFLTNGRDRMNLPKTALSLVLAEDGEDKGEDDFIVLPEAVVTLFANGGCIVAQIDMPQKHEEEFVEAVSLCLLWRTRMISDPDTPRSILLLCDPLFLEGQLHILLTGITYFTSFTLETGEKRILLCFDNEQTAIIPEDGIDFAGICYSIRQEMDLEHQRMMDEYMQLKKQEDDLKNPVSRRFSEQFSQTEIKPSEQKKKDTSHRYVDHDRSKRY